MPISNTSHPCLRGFKLVICGLKVICFLLPLPVDSLCQSHISCCWIACAWFWTYILFRLYGQCNSYLWHLIAQLTHFFLLNFYKPDFKVFFHYLILLVTIQLICWYDHLAVRLVPLVIYKNSTLFYCSPKVIDFHNYSLPKGVSRIIPSGIQ